MKTTEIEKKSNYASATNLHKVKTSFFRISSTSLIITMLVIAFALMFVSCQQDKTETQVGTKDILPERFKIAIPASLSADTYKSATLKSAESDTLQGNEIYENMQFFIALGEAAADLVEEIIRNINEYDIERVIEFTYTSDEDRRIKHLVVESGVTFKEREWDYHLTITDLEFESETDGGIGMQVFWNNSPIAGIAIIKPSNLNINDANEVSDAMYSVEYNEEGTDNYEAYMIIEIDELPMADATIDPYSVDAIKMFVGKKDDIIDVYGNSNHPNAKFFTDDTGFNWAFVASGNQSSDAAVAEVALPPSSLNSDDREVILKDYSIKNVFTKQINEYFIDNYGIRPDSAELANYLKNADAPGFFNVDGFIQAGTAPSAKYDALLSRINILSPYNPKTILELQLEFKK